MADKTNAPDAPQARRSAPPRGKPKKKGGVRTVLKWLLTAVLAFAVLGVGVFAYFWVTTPIPDPNADFLTVNTHMYYDDGKSELGTLSVQNRDPVAYAEIPQSMKDAMVAAENPTFWRDPGISIPAIMRAITTIGSDDVQGGSTITQQYVKILYLNQDKTLTRKLREIIISLKLGQEQSKEQILEGYLNTVYFGRGAYGVEAAAQVFFGVPIAKVTQEQAIVLASLVNAPGLLDPAMGDKQAADLLERYQFVINQLVDMGTITEAQKAPMYGALPEFPEYKRDSRFGGTNGYLMQATLNELRTLGFDDATINGGGLEVTTTFDKKLQDAAVTTAQEEVKQVAALRGKNPKNLHASIVSIDNLTGGVLAMYGGNDDYVKQQRNWATTIRPTGSTFKTWELVAALRQGYPLNYQLRGFTFTAEDGKPIGGHSSGMVTLQDATTNSNNASFVDLAQHIKDPATTSFQAANDAGIPGTMGTTPGWDNNIRVGMGVAEASPVDSASGYSTLANDGVHLPWHVVKEVKDAQGQVVYSAKPQGDQTIEKDIATEASFALEGVARSGTGRVVGSLGYPVAGKTGTRSDGVKTTAAWFVGYTKQITTAVNYVAGDSGYDDLHDYAYSFTGGGYPAQTWLAYMTKAMKGLPSEGFTASNYKPTVTPSPTYRPATTTTTTTTSKPKPTVAPTTVVPTVDPTVTPTQPATPDPTPSARPPQPRPTGKPTP